MTIVPPTAGVVLVGAGDLPFTVYSSQLVAVATHSPPIPFYGERTVRQAVGRGLTALRWRTRTRCLKRVVAFTLGREHGRGGRRGRRLCAVTSHLLCLQRLFTAYARRAASAFCLSASCTALPPLRFYLLPPGANTVGRGGAVERCVLRATTAGEQDLTTLL